MPIFMKGDKIIERFKYHYLVTTNMPYCNTIPGFDFQQNDMYVLELDKRTPAEEVLGLFQKNSGVKDKDVYFGIVVAGNEEAAYLHTEPRQRGSLPEGIKIAIMYDKDKLEEYLDSECDKFKVAGEVITPKLIESVKKELSGK